jgi:hypothetical protein
LLEIHSSPEPLAAIVLSSAIHQLLASLFHPFSPSSPSLPTQLANFFHQHLFTPLSTPVASSSSASNNDGGDERRAALADLLIDGCWQLDQEVEILVPLLVRQQNRATAGAGAEAEAMQVDGGATAAAEQEVVKQSLVIINQGREKLGALVKQLIVRTVPLLSRRRTSTDTRKNSQEHHDLPKQAVLERFEPTLLRFLPSIVSDANLLGRMEVRSKTAY